MQVHRYNFIIFFLDQREFVDFTDRADEIWRSTSKPSQEWFCCVPKLQPVKHLPYRERPSDLWLVFLLSCSCFVPSSLWPKPDWLPYMQVLIRPSMTQPSQYKELSSFWYSVVGCILHNTPTENHFTLDCKEGNKTTSLTFKFALLALDYNPFLGQYILVKWRR